MSTRRIADFGFTIGTLPRGARNAISDVPGVTVGHCTIRKENWRTGVTVVLPAQDNLFCNKLVGACQVLNGFGKTLGLMQLEELGTIETPIALTNTLNVGLVHDALVQYSIDQGAAVGVKVESVNPIVCECNDAGLSDIRRRAVGYDEVMEAIRSAGADFAARKKPVYYITGEGDPPVTEVHEDGSFGLAPWVQAAQERGAVLLDVPLPLNEGERRLWLMPASTLVLDTESSIASLDARLQDENLSDGTVQSILYRKGRYEAFAEAMAQRQQNDLTVMLTHMPCLDTELQSESTSAIFREADLILAGHHVGGQICLPVVGALYVRNDQLPRGGWFPDDRYLTGLNEVNATYQYVSTGLGTLYGPPLNFRLCNPPQISLITLTRQVEA